MAVDFGLDPEVEAFRREVGAFLREAMAPDRVRGHLDPLDLTGLDLAFERELQRECGRRGWLGISVPRELGGGGRPLSYQAMFAYESAYHDAPTIDTALTLAGAPIIAHATDTQRERYLGPMIAGEINISIGYTEAGAGSDLTQIATTAVPRGDGWRLDGVKTLVTGAHKSDHALVIALTDPDGPPRRSMTMFLVDLAAPGVEVRRQPLMNGWTLGDIVLDGVEVDADAVLGTVGEGWRQMASALLAERSGIYYVGFAQRRYDDLVDHLGPSPELDDVALDLGVAHRFAQRVLHQQEAGAVNPYHPAASKIAGTEVLQRLARVGSSLLGLDGLVWGRLLDHDVDAPLHGRLAWEYLDRVRETISVGNNELQRTTIARAELNSDPAAVPSTEPVVALAPTVSEQVEAARAWGADAVTDPHLTATLLPALVAGQIPDEPIGWAEVDADGRCAYVPAGARCRRFLAVRGEDAWLADAVTVTPDRRRRRRRGGHRHARPRRGRSARTGPRGPGDRSPLPRGGDGRGRRGRPARRDHLGARARAVRRAARRARTGTATSRRDASGRRRDPPGGRRRGPPNRRGRAPGRDHRRRSSRQGARRPRGGRGHPAQATSSSAAPGCTAIIGPIADTVS